LSLLNRQLKNKTGFYLQEPKSQHEPTLVAKINEPAYSPTMQELSAIESEQQRDDTGSPPIAARQPGGTKKNLKLWIRPNALGQGMSRSTWDESDRDSSEDQTSRGKAKTKKAEAN
jgi:hypothetical protein